MNKHIRFPGFKYKAFTLSYDDCMRQDKRLVSIMQKNGLKGTFNLNGAMFSEICDKKEKGRMTREEAIDLYLSAGMEIAIHGYHHLSLTGIDPEVAMYDVVEDRKELEKTFGCIIKGMAYAYGKYNDEVVEILKRAGISYARTTVSTEKFDLPQDWLRLPATCHHNNARLMELAREFVEAKESVSYWTRELQLFYVWGHSYEFDNNDNWGMMEEFAEYIGGRDDIWYATNGEIFDYLQACQQLLFSMDGTLVKNMSALDVYIDYYGKNRIIPAGQTVKLD